MRIEKMPGLVLGYHGCDVSVAEKVINGDLRINDSNNSYDWLGHGQYFWESNPLRAMEWAIEMGERAPQKIKTPAVVGAVIDLGVCLNLADTSCIQLVGSVYQKMISEYKKAKITIPKNRNTSDNFDLLLRDLDCAVIEAVHIAAKKEFNIIFDTVRGIFTEGEPIYPNAGFKTKTHIQICVTNPACIRGYFKPI
ncbi:MAG: hypothetical protein FWG90_03015 [Oscillospiraceae bacterium]|nr:hypothetical protein [Oscillospiraceae bacterium]